MDIIVKDLGSVDEKSASQKEQEVLDKASDKTSEDNTVEKVVESTPPEQESVEATAEAPKEETTQPSELKEEDVLSFIKDR